MVVGISGIRFSTGDRYTSVRYWLAMTPNLMALPMRRSAFHSVSYFITHSRYFTNPNGIYFIEKSTCFRKCFFHGVGDGIRLHFCIGKN